MPRYLLDTSALVKRYHPEAGTAGVDGLFTEAGSGIFVSRLALVELLSAFCLKHRNGLISATQCDSYWRRALADVKAGSVRIVRMYARHYGVADDMLRKYAKTRRLRALDALHLGIAADCLKGGLIDRFVTADDLLHELAPLEGITTLNPVLAD